ncbi:MAG TPA: hypothetical protein VI818_06585 [Candidatus Thermoplasmatota archaeon]|nr:hypothetical protein [Candidatus Thermoplasmatota archaeon]
MRHAPLVLFLGAALAGCVGAQEAPRGFQALGETGSFTVGFAYDGRDIQPYDGFLYLDVDDASNTGSANIRGQLGGIYAKPKPCQEAAFCEGDDHAVFEKKWFNVTFLRFQPTQAFHDGGIEADIVEHGDSGLGDMAIPAVDLSQAGWGWAKVEFNGKVLPNPVTGGDWQAHFMVVRNGVRDDASGKILNHAKDAPYDPSNPADGHAEPNDAEIHVKLETGREAKGVTTIVPRTRTANFVTDTQVYFDEFENPALGGKGRAWINVTGGAPVQLVFSLLTPSGAYIKNVTVTRTGGMPAPIDFDANELGNYLVRASGVGANVEYTSTLEFSSRHVSLNLWFETVNTGDKAVQEVKKWGFTPPQ